MSFFLGSSFKAHEHYRTSATNCSRIYNLGFVNEDIHASLPAVWDHRLDMTVDDVWNGFFIHSLLLDHTAPSQVCHLQLALRAHNYRMRDTGQENWNHACELCSWVYTGDDGVKRKSLHCGRSTTNVLSSPGCLRSVVIDGVNMGCPCCGIHNCDNTLDSVHDRFCPEHAHFHQQCAVTSCSEPVQQGFKTCLLGEHRQLELHYYERGKAMFQLKTCLECLKISQTTDSLSVPLLARAEKSRLTTWDELTISVADLQPNTDEADDPPPEGSGDADDHVVVDADSSLCDGKSDAGNWKLHAQFGRKQLHNEELCVASCGTIFSCQRFYGSEAPNGVQVSYYVTEFCIIHLIHAIDVFHVPLSNKMIPSRSDLAW